MKLLLFIAGLVITCGIHTGRAEDTGTLRRSFVAPPLSSAPQTWWHWSGGNISKEGITADLEAMRRIGIGGATIVQLDSGMPAGGPVKILSPEWHGLVQHAFRESQRLGLQIGIENCMGWSSSGGPWVTPEYSMMFVVSSEKQVKGPAAISETLPQPETRMGFYRDIAILAFPTPSTEKIERADVSPKVTSSDAELDTREIVKEYPNGTSYLALPTPQKPQYIQFEFPQPFEARTIAIAFGGPDEIVNEQRDSVRGTVETSDDGHSFRKVRDFDYQSGVYGPVLGLQRFSIPPTTAKYFRITFGKAKKGWLRIKRTDAITVKKIAIEAAPAIDQYRTKANFVGTSGSFPSAASTAFPPEMVVPKNRILNLSSKVDSSGKLTWDVPEGDWTILRMGYTTTESKNRPTPPEATGLECDKLSRTAMEVYWDGLMAKIIKESGPLAGKAFNHTLIDSFEAGSQNWTPAFPEEFRKLTGYDILTYLPTLTGRIVGNLEESERFLWDYRRTIAELFAANYYGGMAALAHKSGLTLQVEPAGSPFDYILSGRYVDMPMTEFWVPNVASPELRSIASISHVYGHVRTAAEAFTGSAFTSRWKQAPEQFKAIGDAAFAYGINHFVFHRYAHQPWLNRYPGISAGSWGANIERTNTWWEQGRAWVTYLTRCQTLLQSGLHVADVLSFGGEGTPFAYSDANIPGYYADSCNADVILNRLSAKDGKLVLPDGMSYRLLVLSKETTMTPPLLRKIKKLVADGATIIGKRPAKSPSLTNYPQCDNEVGQLAAELWDSGKIKDIPVEKALNDLSIQPDFHSNGFTAIHRTTEDAEIYFVVNSSDAYSEQECTFRVDGRCPELWNPVTGKIQKAAAYSQKNGLTQLTLRLEPYDAVFVVFPKNAKSDGDHVVQFARIATGAASPRLEILHATYESAAAPGMAPVDVTGKISGLVQNGKLSFTVSNALIGSDPFPGQAKTMNINYKLDGQPFSSSFGEGSFVAIPNPVPQTPFPDARLTYGDQGQLLLEAWQKGTFQYETASGKKATLNVEADAPTLPIDAAWKVRFQANRGAPPEITLDQLIPWNQHLDTGVKYFSGTGTYSKTFTVPADFIKKNRRYYLDLGKVAVLAEAQLNGHDLGILWKRPFIADITSYLKPGTNELTVAVTNLWVNRLIGDEQLPKDLEWKKTPDGGADWPDWVKEGKPSPTGRVGFNTWFWAPFKKNDPLVDSGLIGPVTIRSSVEVPVAVR